MEKIVSKYILYSFFLIVGLINGLKTFGQDPQFSQFYANSLYLNPALTGNTTEYRLATTYRNQWPSIPGAFVSNTAAFDYNLEKANSGFGLLFSRDKAGSGGLSFTNVGFSYAYYIPLSRQVSLRAGMRFGYTTRKVDASKLVFGDQIARGGASSTIESLQDGINYADISSGILVSHAEKYWLGFALDHINTPNYALVGFESGLPIKLSVHGGWNFSIEQKGVIASPTTFRLLFNYKSQQDWDQLDLGGYYEKYNIFFGAWYRGLQGLKNYENYANNDAMVFLLGYKTGDIKIAYSYDITISRLISASGGAHEISLIYETASKRKKRRKRKFIVPCAKF
jgi:type IX secretion system PorP/SprF family membrane protein